MTLAEWLKGLMYQPQVAGILKCLSEEMVWPGRLHFNHQSFFIASMVQLWMDGVWVYGLMHV